jgi:hypothetical protein
MTIIVEQLREGMIGKKTEILGRNLLQCTSAPVSNRRKIILNVSALMQTLKPGSLHLHP